MADPKGPLVTAFLTDGFREHTPDVPDSPEGWVAVLFNRTQAIALVLGEHNLWTAVTGRASVFKVRRFKTAWAEAREVRPNNDSWEHVRLIPKPAYDAVRVAVELCR